MGLIEIDVMWLIVFKSIKKHLKIEAFCIEIRSSVNYHFTQLRKQQTKQKPKMHCFCVKLLGGNVPKRNQTCWKIWEENNRSKFPSSKICVFCFSRLATNWSKHFDNATAVRFCHSHLHFFGFFFSINVLQNCNR